jgi:hypothetical protein
MIAMPSAWVWTFVSMAALLLGGVLLGIAWIVWCKLGSSYQADPAHSRRAEKRQRMP